MLGSKLPIFSDIYKAVFKKKYQVGKGYQNFLKEFKLKNKRQRRHIINNNYRYPSVTKYKSQMNRQVENIMNDKTLRFAKGLTKGIIKNPLPVAIATLGALGMAAFSFT